MQHGRSSLKRRTLTLAAVSFVALVVAAAASAHAHVSPPVVVSKESQLFSLAVPTEKEGLTTTEITLTVPSGFSIDSFVASPGWHRSVQSTGSGEAAVVQKVTWTGGNVPTGEDSLFQFLAQPASNQTYTFQVNQTYSDGSIVDWLGPESSDTPAPTVEAQSSLGGSGGGGSSNIFTIVAIALGAVAIAIALASRGGKRELA